MSFDFGFGIAADPGCSVWEDIFPAMDVKPSSVDFDGFVRRIVLDAEPSLGELQAEPGEAEVDAGDEQDVEGCDPECWKF